MVGDQCSGWKLTGQFIISHLFIIPVSSSNLSPEASGVHIQDKHRKMLYAMLCYFTFSLALPILIGETIPKS